MERTRRVKKPPKGDLKSPRLIELVGKNPILWDPTYPGYKDVSQKELVWTSISKHFYGSTGKSCQYYWGILRGARSNSKRTAKLKNLSGISRKKKTKPYIYQEQMSFLDKINKNDKQEGNLETIYDKENVSESESAATETETEFDHTFDTDTAMDATQMSMNICNREELKKQLFYKSNQLPSIAMSSSVSDIYSESTIQPNSWLNSSTESKLTNTSTVRKPLGEIQPIAKSSPSVQNPTGAAETDESIDGRISPIFKSSTAERKPSDQNPGGKKTRKPAPIKTVVKKRKYVSRRPSLASISECGDEEDSDCDSPPEILHNNKKTDKLLQDQREQDLLNELRERRKMKISAKVKMHAAAKPPKFNDAPSSSTSIHGLEQAVEEELARIKAERLERPDPTDANTLFFMSLAAKAATLDLKTLNQVTAQMWALVNKAQEDLKKITIEDSSFNITTTVQQKEEFCIIPLTEDQQIVVDGLLRQETNSVIIQKFGITIRGRDLATLLPNVWLDDSIINIYLKTVQNKCSQTFAFDSFFFQKLEESGYDGVKAWTKKVNIFSFKYLLFPIHVINHWVLVVGNTEEKSLVYFDSLNGSHELTNSNKQTLNCLWKYLKNEHFFRKGEELLPLWCQALAEDVPLQENGDDCGVLVCIYSSYLSRGKSLHFDGHADVTMMRRKIVYEIYTSCLLP